MQLEALPGSVLDLKYRIERPLGLGAMGAVFQATHLGTTRLVALKVIVPQLAENQEFAQRFKREAEAAGRLNHPNVVNVTDFGVTQVGGQELAYLVMEYLNGETLADYLKKDPRPSFNFFLDVMDQAGLALDASHAAGIVHRDLKPSNIWLEPNHRGGYNVKVLDFGIAKVANTPNEKPSIDADAMATMLMAPSESSLTFAMPNAGNLLGSPSSLQTSVGTLLGTPAYMAPEQCTGLEVTARVDIYSLAAIAYQMLCGRLPFEADSMRELIRQQIQTVAVSPREHDRSVPEALANLVLSGLEKDPSRRPPTAGAFATRLRATCDGEAGLIRQSKDAFHANLNPFMPVLLICVTSVLLVGMIPLRLAANWAARARLAPEGWLFFALMSACAALVFFALQIFKAACAFMLQRASEKGQVRSAGRPALRAVAAGFGTLLMTQLRSAFDLRPSSFWENILWPVVWVTEGRTGKDAIARSRQLCAALPTTAKNLAVRHYGPALLGVLMLPAMMALLDPSGGALRVLSRTVLAGSALGWFFVFYPLIFGIMFLNFAAAFSFLYASAMQCLNERVEIRMPAVAADHSRKAAASGLRPVTLAWLAAPLLMLGLIAMRASSSAPSLALSDASSDGRRTTLLKLIDGGLGVDQMTADRETLLFDAVRGGDEKLVAELLQRGAKVDVRNSADETPLLIATEFGRNDLARTFLDRGAAANAADRHGRTPLMLAAMRGNNALAQILLQHGASVSPVDRAGKTAAAYAREEGYTELAALLTPASR